jgi:alkylhydroperoxidase family enzyme
MLDYAAKLTLTPAAITDSDVDTLRDHGFAEPQIWEIAFTAGIFNLFTRMADAFGIVPPPFMEQALGLAPASP